MYMLVCFCFILRILCVGSKLRLARERREEEALPISRTSYTPARAPASYRLFRYIHIDRPRTSAFSRRCEDMWGEMERAEVGMRRVWYHTIADSILRVLLYSALLGSSISLSGSIQPPPRRARLSIVHGLCRLMMKNEAYMEDAYFFKLFPATPPPPWL